MEVLKRKRRLSRRNFNSLAEELDVLMNADELNGDEIAIKYKLICDVYQTLSIEDNQVLELLLLDEASEEEENAEYDDIAAYKEKSERIRLQKENLLPTIVSDNMNGLQTNSVSSESKQRKCKLPIVQFKKFKGQIDEWLSFWAQFAKIHEDEMLHSADKFHYLVQSLEPGTEPHDIAQGYPQSAENYPKLVDVLMKRYGDEDKQLQVHLRKLLALVTSNVRSSEKISVENLYHKLTAHLGALKSLNLKKAEPDSWLYPLVESSLPEDILYNWERSTFSMHDASQDRPQKTRLELLMHFLEKEIDIRQRIKISKSFQQETMKSTKETSEKKKATATLSCCHYGDTNPCVFCNKANHSLVKCSRAQTMTYDEKMGILRKKKLCFRCCKNHVPFYPCPQFNLQCGNCGGKHETVMCNKTRKRNSNWRDHGPHQKHTRTEIQTQTSSNVECTTKVALQTVLVRIKNSDKMKVVRAFIDGGSQRSYILKKSVEELQLQANSYERVIHALFGGCETKAVTHQIYKLTLESIDGNFSCEANFRSNEELCGRIPRLANRVPMIMKELAEHKIMLSDVGSGAPPIELLIGADLCGRIRSNQSVELSTGGAAINTKFGWTLLGNMEDELERNLAYMLMSMTITDADVSKLWELDVLGIKDSPDNDEDKLDNERLSKKFQKLISREEDGRYCVKLPWKEFHPPLPDNRDVAFRRLESASRKLTETKLFETYDALFHDWVKEGFIEEVPTLRSQTPKHFIPHRPVVKLESITTPVRPVFDASSHVKGLPSLNGCLETGVNYILKIPQVLLRFREKKIGFTADIRKAFQMITIDVEDRPYLCFMWWKDKSMSELILYRHKSVMFGATCSPSILGAVITKHLKDASEDEEDVAHQLMETLYVDNLLNSVEDEQEYEMFREKSIELFKKARMDLRLWQSSYDCVNVEDDKQNTTAVLGYKWNRKTDTLSLNFKKWDIPEKITKKVLLSCVQRIFDPMGFVAPAVLPMKSLLQKAAINKMKWDQELPVEEIAQFNVWVRDVRKLEDVRIPRMVSADVGDRSKWSVHTFADASKRAYAAAVFLRVETEGGVAVQLLMAKSRVAPISKVSMPRLELLGCLIGARLANTVHIGLKLVGVQQFFWTDSSTALVWIQRNDSWKPFVRNRTKEIVKLCKPDDWKHIPGTENPADLPSRGCTPAKLVESKWWEGPEWLKSGENEWPKSTEQPNEDDVNMERVCTSTALHGGESFLIYNCLSKAYAFDSAVRIVAWMNRFVENSRIKNPTRRVHGRLGLEERQKAEKSLLINIQLVNFTGERLKELAGLQLVRGEEGLLRVKTRLVYREDPTNFKYPILLPGKDLAVKRLIEDWHNYYCHPPVGSLQVKLRRKYWIVKQKKSISNVTSKCVRCRRLASKPLIPEPAPLPLDRIKDAEPFEVIGVDAAGPLILKSGKKVWFIIFTCAIYRAVHFELVSAMSAKAFINALGKFIEKYRRPAIIYCDNGTNFRGADNLFKQLDWERITVEKNVNQIVFKFNPVSAAWWGGFWERLIRTVKDMMKRTLGNRTVNGNELERLLRTVEDAMNDRPLTYISENPEDLEPLTPSLFIRPLRSAGFPEKVAIDANELRKRYKYVEKLKKELAGRFKVEYLAFLVNRSKQKATRAPQVGELVLVGDDSKKRIYWPLGRILELSYSKDGKCRLVKVKTARGVWDRPLQRIFPLELDGESGQNSVTYEKKIQTQAGRLVSLPVTIFECLL